MKKCCFIFVTIVAVSVMISCSNDNQNKELTGPVDSVKSVTDSIKIIPANNVEMVISDIPFPFEILEKLHSSHISFDQKAMNPISNINKYNQYNSKALNLGVYGADLSYVVTYEQFELIGAYIKNSKKLADDLNIPFAFNQDMLDKYSKYKDNKDSLTHIVYDSYNQVDKTLKNDERVGIAALVVTGSWLEGLYLSTKTFLNANKDNTNVGLYKTIGGQKQSLGIVIKLLSEYKNDAYILGIMKDLEKITSLYDKITTNLVLNEKELLIIHKEVEKLRYRITEGL